MPSPLYEVSLVSVVPMEWCSLSAFARFLKIAIEHLQFRPHFALANNHNDHDELGEMPKTDHPTFALLRVQMIAHDTSSPARVHGAAVYC